MASQAAIVVASKEAEAVTQQKEHQSAAVVAAAVKASSPPPAAASAAVPASLAALIQASAPAGLDVAKVVAQLESAAAAGSVPASTEGCLGRALRTITGLWDGLKESAGASAKTAKAVLKKAVRGLVKRWNKACETRIL